jgi:outer membrane protein assembly factor BamB
LGLNRDSDGALLGVTPRWVVRAFDPAHKEYPVFEGAPLVHDGRVYLAATRFEGSRVVTAIHCYPAHSEDTTAPLLWRTDVCETRELLPTRPGEAVGPGQYRYRHHLLTLAGSRLVYCSHSGAIVAMDARTGRRAWGLRYPQRDARVPVDQPNLRDLAPPLYADGRVYVAPADSDRLYCLDPYTGALIWERDRLDVVHLVGVGKGRLIFTTWRNPKQGLLHPGGLRAVMAEDGNDQGGWSLPDDGGGLMPMGRPLMLGDLVLWPSARSRFGVFAIRQEDGMQADNPSLLHGVPSGHLLYVNGYLLVTDAREMRVFVPEDRLTDGEAKVETPADWRRRAYWVAEQRPKRSSRSSETRAAEPTFPLEEKANVSLNVGERYIPIGDSERLWTSQGHNLLAHSRASGTIDKPLSLGFTPTWGRIDNGRLYVGGDGGIVALDRASQKITWRFPDRHVADRFTLPFVGFQLVGERLLFQHGARNLFCLDATNGTILWSRWAPGATFDMPPPRGRYHYVCPVGDRIVAQASARRWLLDARDGAILDTSPATLEPWPRAPLILDKGQMCLVPNADEVHLLDVARGKTVWTYRPRGETTRSGEAPRVLDAGEHLVVLEPGNLGTRVQKLDRATGKAAWSRSPMLDVYEMAASAWLATSDVLYHAAAGQMSAWSLANAKLLWRRTLEGEGTWRLERCGKTILAWLSRSTSVRYRWRSLLGSLQWDVGPLPSAGAWTVHAFDAQTGDSVQRMTIEPESLPREPVTHYARRGTVMPMVGVDRAANGAPGPTVIRDRHGVVVALGNRVKVFTSANSSK